jgi:type IV secretory pathway TraG/TraD family ATPase VirD4
MRAWKIIVFLLLLGWALFIGPPASWVPGFEWLWSHVGPFFMALLGLFVLPGVWVVSHIWPGFGAFLTTQSDQGSRWLVILVGLPSFVFIAVFSYVFWITLLSRFWKFIGRWDPFGPGVYQVRPYFLKMITGISDWWERETKFGQHATGGFASLLGVLSNEFHHGDIFLGRPKLIVGGMLRPIGIPTQKHFVTLAGTGSGKSTAGIIPNLCLHEGNVLVIDPKGELAAITARRRGHGGGGVRGMQDDVFVLDPFHIVEGFQTASYNVFDEMERVAEYDADRPVSYARKVAQALVPSTSKDPYWDDAPRTFISGLLLHIFQGPKEQRNLVRLRELIMEGDVGLYQQLMGVGGDQRGDAFDALLTMMKRTPEGPYRHVIVGSANSLSKMSPNQRGSVLTMAMEHTSFLDMPEIRKISMKSDFLLEDLKTRKISVYLCLPLNAVSGIEGRWLRMFIMLTVDMFSRVNKAPDPPLLLAIDEFPSLGKLDGIEVVAPTMRSQGVRLWVIGQDIEQFEKVYPESWGSFIGGAEAVQFMGITHPPTVAYIAERLGQHVVVEQQQMGQGQIRENRTERPLRDPEQIARMVSPDSKNQIIWRGNKRPLLLKLCPYFEYMPWWYYSRDRRFPEKWNRWIWRRRSYSNGGMKVAYKPPDKAPEEKPQGHPTNVDWIRSYLPDEPQNLEPTDIVPGTKMTWGDTVRNFMKRGEEMEEDLERKRVALRSGINPYVLPKRPEPPPVSSPPLSPPPKAGVNGSMRELEELIGLADVKKQVVKTANLMRLGKERDRQGKPKIALTHHLVFTGNPGTGKTTVARIIGRIYKEMGLLKSGHMVEAKRADLVAEFIGKTAPQVKAVMATAMDGVLFIDEAYSLMPAGHGHDFAAEAVAELLTGMEDSRDRLVVIAAGYKDEMEKFVNSNPGLKSRFKTIIDFEDYSPADLMKIFVYEGAKAGIRLSLDAMIAVQNLMESLETGTKGFGNGRTVRNIFEECLARQAARLVGRTKVDISVFEVDDIPKVGEMKFS